MNKKALVFFVPLLISSLLVSCGNNPSNLLSGTSTKGLMTPYDTALGKNPEKTLRIIGAWTKTGIVNQWHAGTDAGPMIMYGIEGLVQYVRTTDTYYYLLAESVTEDADGNTIIKIRPKACWQNGEDFTAMDVIAYYAIDYQNEVCKYFSKIEAVDTKTVKITWKKYRTPTSEAKLMLLASDTKLGSIKYSEFKSYVDESLQVIANLPDVSQADLDSAYSKNLVQPYGKVWDSGASSNMGEILQKVRAFEPTWFIATGPYKLKKYTETEMILEKNDKYYLDNSKAFETIYCYQQPSNVNQIYSMLANGKVDYYDGAPLPEAIDSILEQNLNMVNYKMIDQNSCGMIFNLEKKWWKSIKVREAFQYLFDRQGIVSLTRPYATVSWYPMMTMTQAQAEYWMNPDDFAKLPKFSYDTAKTEILLKEAGWSKNGNAWFNEEGTKVELTLGVENNTMFIDMAQSVQSMLNVFGIHTTIKIGENWNTWFSTARQDNSPYDFVVGVTDANSYTTHPYGFMKHFFDVLDAHLLHLPTSDVTLRWSLPLERPGGKGTVDLVDELDKLYLIQDNDLRVATGNIVYGFSKYLYGIQFYENMTGSFFDSSRVWGLPGIAELAKDDRNITYIPKVGDKYFNAIADLNSYYTQGSVYGIGKIYPRD